MIRRARRIAAFMIVAVTVLVLTGSGGAAPAQTVTDGAVAAVDGGSVTIAARTGAQVRVLLTGDTRVIRRQPVRFDQIKPRDFIGVTAKKEADGGMTAVAINIFPPEYKGRVREGQFLMETGNLMTNAVVFQNVRRIEGRTLYLTFPEGTAVINVPRDAEIFRLTQIRAADLRVGMRVTVRSTMNPDGSMNATSITVDAS